MKNIAQKIKGNINLIKKIRGLTPCHRAGTQMHKAFGAGVIRLKRPSSRVLITLPGYGVLARNQGIAQSLRFWGFIDIRR